MKMSSTKYKVHGRRALEKFWHFIHFHKTIHFKSLKEYFDFKESWKLKALWNLSLFYPGFFSPVGLSVELTTPEDFDDEQIARSQCHNLPLLSKEVKENLGKKVKFQFHEDKDYTLLGLEVTHEDYYYILDSSTGKKCYETCVSKINIIN